jgi:hypothetical protein
MDSDLACEDHRGVSRQAGNDTVKREEVSSQPTEM